MGNCKNLRSPDTLQGLLPNVQRPGIDEVSDTTYFNRRTRARIGFARIQVKRQLLWRILWRVLLRHLGTLRLIR
jgi:hypothetical protein